MSAETTPTTAYIAVGSNVEPEIHILKALESLSRHARIVAVSTFYRTPAIGRPDLPDYLNGMVRIETSLECRELKFGVLRKIESEEGRVRDGDKFGPRAIDLDLALYADRVVNDADMTLPSTDIESRLFVSVPLCELDPDLRLPGRGTRIVDLFSDEERRNLKPCHELTNALRRHLGLA